MWVKGKFDKRSKDMSVVEYRMLHVEGRQQQVRFKGQNVCEAMVA